MTWLSRTKAFTINTYINLNIFLNYQNATMADRFYDKKMSDNNISVYIFAYSMLTLSTQLPASSKWGEGVLVTCKACKTVNESWCNLSGSQNNIDLMVISKLQGTIPFFSKWHELKHVRYDDPVSVASTSKCPNSAGMQGYTKYNYLITVM